MKNRLIDILKSEMRQSQSGEAAAYEQIDFTINDVTVLDSLIEEEERLELSRKIKSLLNLLTPRQQEGSLPAIYMIWSMMKLRIC